MRSIISATLLLPLVACSTAETDEVTETTRPATASPASAQPTAPRGPRFQVSFQPMDLTTSVADSELALVIDGPPLGDDERAAFASAVELVEWPSGRPVPVKLEHVARSEGRFASLEVRPAEPLTDRWYALTFDADRAPDSRAVGLTTPFGLRTAARFRVGSEAVLQKIDVCRSDDGVHVRAQFSERLVGAAKVSDAIEVATGGRSLACKSHVEDALGDEAGVALLSLDCPAIELDAEVTLRFAPSLRTLGGKGLVGRDGKALRATFVPNRGERLDDACTRIRGEIVAER